MAKLGLKLVQMNCITNEEVCDVSLNINRNCIQVVFRKPIFDFGYNSDEKNATWTPLSLTKGVSYTTEKDV